jgi:superoxide dismutase, Fe-Mn family
MRETAMHPPPRVTITRRRLLRTALAGAAVSICGVRRAVLQVSGPFSLPPLPYPEDALAPAISSTTIGFHYGKHQRAYVDNRNKAVEGTDLAGKSLDDIGGPAGYSGI